MAQYQVPQFIDVEDKVFGPLTIRQFLYIAGGAVMVAILYNFFKLWVLLVLGGPVVAFVLALAFYKHNGIPFPKVFMSMVSYALSKKLYLWKRKESPGSIVPGLGGELPELPQKTIVVGMSGMPELSKNQSGKTIATLPGGVQYVVPPQNKRKSVRLADLAWSLDVQPASPIKAGEASTAAAGGPKNI